ncbi:hypothetical protein [Xenorhabdus bharatensis]|uniref:hypothetical protein n=1 Tax=Xenorhabdus bharatensis TaxID=3136256 RepID=UPI0030F3B169
MTTKNNQHAAPYLPQKHNDIIDEAKQNKPILLVEIEKYERVHCQDKIIVYLNEYIHSQELDITSDNINDPKYQIKIPFYTIPPGEYDIFYTIIDWAGNSVNSATNSVIITNSNSSSPFGEGNQAYLFSLSMKNINNYDESYEWAVYPISPVNGLGKALKRGHWPYAIDFPCFFVEKGQTYTFGRDFDNNWFIRQISINGPGPVVAQGKFTLYPDSMIIDNLINTFLSTFVEGEKTYLYVLTTKEDYSEKNWFIYQISTEGLSRILQQGKLPIYDGANAIPRYTVLHFVEV